MKSLDLDALPGHSAWARYLLDPVGEPPEAPEAYTSLSEYDAMYAHLLEEYRKGRPDPEEFTERVYARGREDLGPVSIHEDVYLASPGELRKRDEAAVREALLGVESTPETVIDLGCGWGSALGTIANTVPDATVVGGEYSPHGVELARALHADVERVSVEEFDFRGEWDLLDESEGETLLFTRGAVTTLPDPEEVVDRFGALAAAGAVTGGVHLEQVGIHPETTLGLLRRRYARFRGYSGELLALLERQRDIDVIATDYDILGPNPLHPRSMIRWRAC